ncbi:MAG: hypothetical protein ABEJ40_05690 [Haloarculaceae archaeon]
MLEALDPHKVVLPIIALIGLVPVVLHYRAESRWFVVGYLLLVVATLATNLESLFLGGILNYVEHVVGLLGAGIAFLAAGYVRRRRVVGGGGDPDEEVPEATATDGGVGR